MVIHNATFMVRRDLEGDLVLWLKGETAGLSYYTGKNPRISAMREAGGIRSHEADAASVAFQVEFPDEEEALRWRAEVFTPLAGRFTSRFGSEESMAFTSLFEVV